ncbi:MAG TPA: Fe-S cluster assembly protein SufD [Chthoniobacteraceae bacterium]|nr:Fe-S cluster assembly protein SufD [Chthoniobacteraceae bacterium]
MSSPDRAENSSPAAGAVPDWFEALQAEGRQRFESLPMPTRRNEAWRFTDLKEVDLTPYGAAKPLPESEWKPLVARSKELEKTAGRMVFANDVLVEREILSESLRQKGVIWKPLDQAAIDHPELFRKHFMAHGAALGSEKFAALHQASVRSGTFLYVPRGVTIDLPIEVFHWLSGENASTFPHTLLIAEANSKVTLIDYFLAADPEAPGLSIGVNDLHLAEGAQLNYICLQEWSSRARAFQINNTVVAANATAKSLNVNLGGAYARTESLSKLMGEGARSDMLSVTVAKGEQEFDQRTLQDHYAPGAYSDLLYKNSLDDRARTIFAGLIKVELGAHRTDAYQKVRNLMLSDEAEANSAPGLEILADDVRCTHGATAGEIDREELFYLAARGIGRDQAQRLIVHGFLKEAINRLEDPAIIDLLARRVAKKFGVSV